MRLPEATEPTMTELWRMSAAQLTQGYEKGEFTPGEVLEALLVRVAQCQPHLNAFVQTDRVGAKLVSSASRLRWARHMPLGPLDGVPVSLKDNLHAQGFATSWGSRLLKGFVARKDEAPVARLRAAGAMLFGKTNLPEFATQGYTGNLVQGVTRNPWDLALTPGGSSGGAAAAVAAGCGPVALGTDGGGSIRRPASHCGLVGFKPSGGLVPRGGGVPEIYLEYEVPGVLARTVGDVAAVMDAITPSGRLEPAEAAPSRILYVPTFGTHPVDPGIAERVAEGAKQLEALGHKVEQAPSFDLAEEVNERWMLLPAAGLAWLIGRGADVPEFGLRPGEKPDESQLGEALQARLAEGRQAGAAALFDLFGAVHRLRQRLDELYKRYDWLLTPATAALPWPAQETHPGEIAGQAVGPRGHAIFTGFANAAGLPGIALPCGHAEGLPTGFQLVGRSGSDAQLLALAAQYEEAHPWAQEWPALPVA
jgi:aspartyl-tRNA(Asn)/glutamyl-tRNA(Gln) amidotransferase subunit A